ncbi:MAG: glutaminyl-peptide cyclotransferase [Ardenticatenales bacterium]
MAIRTDRTVRNRRLRRTGLWAVGLTALLAGCRNPAEPSLHQVESWITSQALTPPATASDGAHGQGAALALVPDVVASYPHDPAAFTQGLLLDGGVLYESTGLEGQSTLREVDLATGNVLRRHDLPADVFAEGLALVGDRLIQISWQEQRAFTYDEHTFASGPEFAYSGEGWGLCSDGTRLIMSNGSDRLTFRDPATFNPSGQVSVTLDGQPVPMLNELECVDGMVYANVWQTNQIVAIDPTDGFVTASIDAANLWERMADRDPAQQIDVLNGIAYDPADQTFLVTGKLWPKLFRVRFVPSAATAPVVP